METTIRRHVRYERNRPVAVFTAECVCGWTTAELPSPGFAHGAAGRHEGKDVGHPSELCRLAVAS